MTFREFFQELRSSHQYFAVTLFLSAAVGGARAFSLDNPVNMALQAILFVIGTLLAHTVFLFDQTVLQAAHRRIPIGESQGELPPARSPLRQGIMLLLLPVLSLFIVTSTRAALGLGFFWGLSSIFWWDLLRFFNSASEKQRIHHTYFDQFTERSIAPQLVTAIFLIYGVLLTAFILTVRGTV